MSQYGVAIVGCGNIAGPYVQDLKTYPEIRLLGVADTDVQRAQAFAGQHGTEVYDSLEALLADPHVDIVVNLTSHFAHKEVTERSLKAKKHVYSEKPLATRAEDAMALVELAKTLGLRLACSPFTLIGEAQQTTWKWIRENRLGTVRVAYADVNWGRIESWHPAPASFYEIGALFDVGVYPLTILTAILGPVRRVIAYGKVLLPERVTEDQHTFHITTPDFAVTVLEIETGAVVRLTTDFYVSNQSTRQTGIEFHGDAGSLVLESWHNFSSRVLYAEFGQALEEVPLIRPNSDAHVPWGRGVHELVRAMLENRPHRFSGEQAAHVTEVLTAAARSMAENRPVDVHSRFAPPQPMEWAE